MIPAVSTSKQEIRQYCLARLSSISQKRAKANKICNKLLAIPQLQQVKHILVYYPLATEVDIAEFTQACIKMGKEVFLPFFHRQAIGKYQAPLKYFDRLKAYEPQLELIDIDLDMVIIPGLAFDKQGYRLGRGNGWYDRFLKNKEAFKIAVSYDELLQDSLPHEAHDIKVDMVITPMHILTIT